MLRFLATRRRKFLFALCVVLALVLGPYLVSRLRSPGRLVRIRSIDTEHQLTAAESAPQPVTSLRLLAYNIAHGRGDTAESNWEGTLEEKRQRIADIAALLREANADVVVLNEVDFSCTWSGHQNQAEAIARSAGYPYLLEQRNLDLRFLYGSWKFGNAVLSRYPIVAAEPLALPPVSSTQMLLAGGKKSSVCRLALSDTQQLRLVAVHFDTRGEDIRVGSAEAILAAAAAGDLPLVALGDFNSTLPGFPDSRRTPSGANAMETLRSSGRFVLEPLTPPTPDQLTFPSTGPLRTIDWILIPTGWHFTDYRVLASPLSDHLPVIADVQLPTVEAEEEETTDEGDEPR